jgi:hypothetical protein
LGGFQIQKCIKLNIFRVTALLGFHASKQPGEAKLKTLLEDEEGQDLVE